MENVVLVVVVPLVGERGKGAGGGSDYLKTAQIFNQHALIKIWDLKYYPILNSMTLQLLTQIYIWPWLLNDTCNQEPGINLSHTHRKKNYITTF